MDCSCRFGQDPNRLHPICYIALYCMGCKFTARVSMCLILELVEFHDLHSLKLYQFRIQLFLNDVITP